MKKMVSGAAIFFALTVTPAYAADDTVTGKIIRENEVTAVLETDGAAHFQAGDDIELSYMAGFMEILLGRFRVKRIEGKQYFLDTLALNARSSGGMNVKAVKAGAPLIPDYQAPQLSSPKSGGENEVAGVFGDDILIEQKSGASPAVGDLAKVRYVTGTGMAIEVGTWTVTKIEGVRVQAALVQKSTAPRKGMKVSFEPDVAPRGQASFPDSAPAVSPGPAAARQNQGTLSLLGVPAPSGQEIDRNLFSPTYGQPVDQEAQRQQGHDQFKKFFGGFVGENKER
ncbi:MAG: hypothetical protein KTQ49_00010 [Candidatus Omnitrophica bacterium]|nr:hypothetical protein [Candidatus Omnitrophota bacterium]